MTYILLTALCTGCAFAAGAAIYAVVQVLYARAAAREAQGAARLALDAQRALERTGAALNDLIDDVATLKAGVKSLHGTIGARKRWENAAPVSEPDTAPRANGAADELDPELAGLLALQGAPAARPATGS